MEIKRTSDILERHREHNMKEDALAMGIIFIC